VFVCFAMNGRVGAIINRTRMSLLVVILGSEDKI
jgi:hypothetical protein